MQFSNDKISSQITRDIILLIAQYLNIAKSTTFQDSVWLAHCHS